ncbi:MAG TPA: hypothetical protein VEB42_02925 [Chitinophagaceae bacterium]|nr:hypothetical protein [Chitinophagaceae bacterium]
MNLQSPIYSIMVAPPYCRLLLEEGLTQSTPYHYVIIDGLAELNTYAFDRDDYYAQADANVCYTNKDHKPLILPAYTIMDLEKTLPDYCICRCNGKYELSVEGTFPELEVVKEDRLPDALALMVMQGIRKRVLRTENINERITQL